MARSDEPGGIATHATPLDARESGALSGGPSFSLRNRIERAIFIVVWALAASWTPPPFHRWRCLLLRAFGARIGRGVRLYRSTVVWHPGNLTIGDGATIGPRVRLYDQGTITIGPNAVISQGAHICASSHDVSDPHFQLILRPIRIEANAWIAADAFIGPGITAGEGAVLGARSVAVRDLAPWTIYGGNPAVALKPRVWRDG